MELMGKTFRPMTKVDWNEYAGVDEGSLICCCKNGDVMFYSPLGFLDIIHRNGSNDRWKRMDDGSWKSEWIAK
jgi:hypothetical protein